MPKHFPAPFILSAPTEAHPNSGFALKREVVTRLSWRSEESLYGNSSVCCRVGSIQQTAKAPTRSGYGLIRERASEATNLLNVALAQRGAPGDSDDLEALILVIWFPCILLSCLLPYPSGVGPKP